MPGARAAATGRGLPPRPPSATPGPGRQTFEDSMVHEVLCVTRRFTACCALHRCLSRGVLHDDVSGLGWGLGRRGASRHVCVVSRRRNATWRLPRLSGLTPLLMSSPQPESPAESAAFRVRSPKGLLRCRTARLLRPPVFLYLCFLFVSSGAPGKPLAKRPGADDDVVIVVCPPSPPRRDS